LIYLRGNIQILGFFDILAGQYSNIVSIDTVLKAHDGDPIRVDRKGRESESIEKPALTMFLSVQENVLDGLLNNEVFQSRGLTARILFSKPTSKIGSRKFDTPEIPPDTEKSYNDLIMTLLNKPNAVTLILKLDTEAYEAYKKFFDKVEGKLTDSLEILEGWGRKLVGSTLRIAGILHCIKNSNSPSKVKVTEQTIKEAIRIGKYFLAHAKYTFSLMGVDKATQGAKHILKRLSAQSKTELTKYEIFRLCRSRMFKKTDDILPSLDTLL